MLKQELLHNNTPRMLFQVNTTNYQMPAGCVIEYYRRPIGSGGEYNLFHSLTWPGSATAIANNMAVTQFIGHSIYNYE